MGDSEVNVSDKILLAIYELEKKRKSGEKLTKEDLALLNHLLKIQIWLQKITGRFKK